jgi:hypothetical protein
MLNWKLRSLLVSFLMWKELSVTRFFLLNKVNPAVYFRVFGCLHQWIFENNLICDWKSGLHIITHIPMPHLLIQHLWPNAYTMLEHHCPDLAHFLTFLLSLKGVSLWIPLHVVQCGNITESLYTIFQHCSQARQKCVSEASRYFWRSFSWMFVTCICITERLSEHTHNVCIN